MQKFHAKGQLSSSGKHITLSGPKLTRNAFSYFSLIKGLLGDCHQFFQVTVTNFSNFSGHQFSGDHQDGFGISYLDDGV